MKSGSTGDWTSQFASWEWVWVIHVIYFKVSHFKWLTWKLRVSNRATMRNSHDMVLSELWLTECYGNQVVFMIVFVIILVLHLGERLSTTDCERLKLTCVWRIDLRERDSQCIRVDDNVKLVPSSPLLCLSLSSCLLRFSVPIGHWRNWCARSLQRNQRQIRWIDKRGAVPALEFENLNLGWIWSNLCNTCTYVGYSLGTFWFDLILRHVPDAVFPLHRSSWSYEKNRFLVTLIGTN